MYIHTCYMYMYIYIQVCTASIQYIQVDVDGRELTGLACKVALNLMNV